MKDIEKSNLKKEYSIAKKSISVTLLNILKNLCSQTKEKASCGGGQCERCLISFLESTVKKYNKSEEIENKKLSVYLRNIPLEDNKDYDKDKIVEIFAYFLMACKKCINHDEKYNYCPANIALAYLESIITSQKNFKNIVNLMNSKSIFLRIKRVTNYNLSLGQQLFLIYRENHKY